MSCFIQRHSCDHTNQAVFSDRVRETDEYFAEKSKELENREARSRAQIDEALNQLDARCLSPQDMLQR